MINDGNRAAEVIRRVRSTGNCFEHIASVRKRGSDIADGSDPTVERLGLCLSLLEFRKYRALEFRVLGSDVDPQLLLQRLQLCRCLPSADLSRDLAIKPGELLARLVDPSLVRAKVEERVDEPNLLGFALCHSHDLALAQEVA